MNSECLNQAEISDAHPVGASAVWRGVQGWAAVLSISDPVVQTASWHLTRSVPRPTAEIHKILWLCACSFLTAELCRTAELEIGCELSSGIAPRPRLPPYCPFFFLGLIS